MQWFANDLSLDGQFKTPDDFRAALEPLLSLRMRSPYLHRHLYCSRLLSERHVTGIKTFREVVYALPDRNFKQMVLSWITKQGPFWDDDREPIPDDYFEFQAEDVTEQGLGEAARRCISGDKAGTCSFKGSRFNFEVPLITVQHGLTEKPIGWVDIINFWEISQLETEIEKACPDPRNWIEAMEYACNDFGGLIFSKDIVDCLKCHPFSQSLSQRVFERLKVLNKIVAETKEGSSLSDKGKQLLDLHFVGKKAWFTDESETNKNTFKNQLTFPDPDTPIDNLFCGWHGKIKTPQFRIHFEWPRPAGQAKIKVVYIGPKITKS